jgi:hypothetical protein
MESPPALQARQDAAHRSHVCDLWWRMTIRFAIAVVAFVVVWCAAWRSPWTWHFAVLLALLVKIYQREQLESQRARTQSMAERQSKETDEIHVEAECTLLYRLLSKSEVNTHDVVPQTKTNQNETQSQPPNLKPKPSYCECPRS